MKTKEFLGLKENKRGQATIEAVLLVTILIGLFTVITKTAQEKQLLANLVNQAIKNIATMSGYGTWKEGCASPGRSAVSLGKCHPNSIARSLSSDPTP